MNAPPADTDRLREQLATRHRETLDRATGAVRERGYWSAYPESPSPRVYGENAARDGEAAFEAHLGRRFELGVAGEVEWVGDETSPYGRELGISYPRKDVDGTVSAARASVPAWRDAGPQIRATACVEMIDRLNRRSFEIAHAVMHTTGQPYVMAFQAGGPHAQDRALEAVACALTEQTRVTSPAVWEKPQGSRPPVRMEKTFTVVPRGVALVIGCRTFPTWNAYPGLFASLATGNAVLVKPHPAAVLPLAITVAVVREVLGELGFDPALVVLVPERPGELVAAELAVRADVGVVDFTGSTDFGDWLEQHALPARVYTEKAGVNTVIIESTSDYRGMLGNLAFSLVLYSGQMCTTPQNLLVGAAGIQTDVGHKSVEQLVADLGAAIDATLGEDAKAVELLGALAGGDILGRLESASVEAVAQGRVAVPSRAVAHPTHPGATVRTPLVVRVDPDDEGTFGQESFGPVSYLVTTSDPTESVAIFRSVISRRGALTASVYSTDERFLAHVRSAALDVGVALSENLTSTVYVNQSSAFSDFHGSGANPAANASYTNADFVTGRFHVVQTRRHVAADETT